MNYSYKQVGKFNHVKFIVPDNWSNQSIAYFLGRLAQCQVIDDTCQPDADDNYKDKNRVMYIASHQNGVSMTPDRVRVYDDYTDARAESQARAKQS